MFKITISENGVLFKGSFDMGAMGKFTDDMVEIDRDFTEFIMSKPEYMGERESNAKHKEKDNSQNPHWAWHISKYDKLDHILSSDMGVDEKIAVVERFYAKKQESILKNAHKIEELILTQFVDFIIDCEFNFWGEDGEYEDYIIPEEMPKFDLSEDESEFYAFLDETTGFGEFYAGEQTITREIMGKYFKMIDVDKLFDSLQPEHLVFDGDIISFQLSTKGSYGVELFCSACGKLMPDFSVYDWHNH